MMELIDKKDFTKAVLDEDVEAFIVHMISLSLGWMTIYRARKAQIALLLIKEVTVLTKYINFTDVFSKKLLEIFPKWTYIN